MAREILLVEDDVATREGLAEMLRAHGHVVRCASNGLDALERLGANPEVGLIVTDLHMPVMDGWTFIEQLEVSGICLPTLAFTSATDDLAKLPVDGVIRKPVDVRELLERIDRLSRAPPQAGDMAAGA